MPQPVPVLRMAVAATATGALALGLLAGTLGGTAAAAPVDPAVASGPDWTVTRVAGGHLVTLELDEPLPVVSDAPTLVVDGVDLGPATESADGLSLSVVTADDSVADAEDVEQGWVSGDDAKAEPFDAPVTSTDEPVEPSDLSKADLEELAAGDDGSLPGPYGYQQDDYDYGDQALPTAGLGGIRQELTGRIYLTDAPGARPTIVLLHGRHTSCATLVSGTTNPNRWPCVTGQTEVPSYKGYDGTGQTLATWGYNVISISANAINANDAQLSVDNGALARGQLTIDSLRMVAKWNAGDPAVYRDEAKGTEYTVGEALDAPQADVGTTDLNQIDPPELVGKFDLTHVGLMGHSRGGEGVTSAVTLNQALAQPFGIESVLPLAPVDFSRMTVSHTPMLVVLPYCDGDVSNQQGQHFIDDSRYAHDDSVLLSTVWMMGANHNFFNTVWTPGKYPYAVSDDWGATSTDTVCGPRGVGNIRLSADDQYKAGTAYMSAWFRMTVAPGEPGFLPMFDGSTKPTLASVPTADVRVLGSAPADERVDIARFTAFDSRIRSFGTATVQVCASASGRTLPQPLPYCGTTSTVRSTSAMPHWTPASYAPNVPASPMTKFLWTSNTGQIRVTVPPAARNAAARDMLVFKTAPDEAVTTGTDLTLTVVDGAGATWSSPVAALNPLAVRRMPASTSTTLNKIVLQQVSVPVASMTGINTADVREVRFTAGVGADATANGGVYLSDLALADSSVGTPEKLTAAPTVNVDPTTVEEGSASADTKSVAVVLSKAATAPVSAWFTLIGSTATGSKAGLAATEVRFAPGETCKAVEVPTSGDALPGTAALTSYKTEISNQSGAVYGSKAFGTLVVREDDGLTSGTPAPAVGVQGDVCAEYAAKSQVFALTAADDEPAPGETVTLTGSGFRSGESVAFTDGSTSPTTAVGSAIAGPDGNVSLDLVLPADAALGLRTVTAVGAGSGRTARTDLSVLAPTTSTLTLTPAAPAIKEAVTLTATVASDVVGADTTAPVEFFDGAMSLGVAPVSGGTATLSLPEGFLAGEHAVRAVFGGSATAGASTSPTVTFTLVKGGTTVVISLPPATAYGTGASGTVTVGGASGGSVRMTGPSGPVDLPLDAAGTARFPLAPTLEPGSYPLAFEYAGTDSLAPSSLATAYAVTKATPYLKLTVLKASSNGKKAKAKVLVSVVGAPAGAAPTGSVELAWGKVRRTVTASSTGVPVTLKKKKGKVPASVALSYGGDGRYVAVSLSEVVF